MLEALGHAGAPAVGEGPRGGVGEDVFLSGVDAVEDDGGDPLV